MRFQYAKVLALVLVSSGIGVSQEPESHLGRNFTSLLPGAGQSARSISLDVKDVHLSELIQKIADQAGLQLSWSGKVVLDRKVSLTLKNVDVQEALGQALRGSGAKASISSNGKMIVIVPEKQDSISRQSQATGTVRGRVIDSASKNGVPGVAVSVLGTRAAAVTKSDGTFSIPQVPLGRHTLIARLLGYRSGERAIVLNEKSPDINVTFAVVASASRLSEVVTTATGQQRRLEVGNDIVKINAREIMDRAPVRSVSDLIRHAQVPGVNVLTASGEPGAPTRIRMRGIGSISQSTDPAIIVDGIWVNSKMSDSSIINRAFGAGGQSRANYTPSPIDNIDPATIETVEFIRGPSAASLYGHEAANGVIVFTTRRGSDGQASWSYSYSHDWDAQVRAKNGYWVGYGTDVFGNFNDICTIRTHYNLDCIQDSTINLNRFGFLLDESGPGSIDIHRLSVRGGSNKITYSLSTSYQDNIGTRRTPRVDMIRARLLNISLPSELRYPGRKKDLSLSSAFGFTPNRILNIDLTVNANNSNLRQGEIEFSGDGLGSIDTMAVLNRGKGLTISTGGSDAFHVSSGISVNLRPDSWWNMGGSVGADITERRDHGRNDFRDCDMGVCEPLEDVAGAPRLRLRQGSGSTKVLTGRTFAGGKISTPFDRFVSFTPSIHLDIRRNMDRQVLLNLSEVPFGAEQGSGNGNGSMTANDVITAGYAVTTGINVMDKMYFDIGFRQDAGSVIKRNSSSSYPRLSTSWVVSEEGFFPKNRLIEVLVLRGAFGYAAVHPEEADVNGGYRYRRAIINDEIIWVGELGSVGNNKLVPERSFEFEGGFDVYLPGDRAELIFNFVNKYLRNAIIDRSLPPSSGLPTTGRKENISRVQNRSIEVTLNTSLIDNDLMLLRIGGSMATVNNVIRRLGNNAIVNSNTSRDRLVEGYQIGSVWDLPVLGYGDVNGDGYIAQNELILGDTTVYKGWNTPKFTAAYTGEISLLQRNLTFSFSLSQQGPHVQYATFRDNYGEVVVGAPLPLQALSVASRVRAQRSGGTAMNVSELRLNTVSVSYNLPKSFSQRLNSKLIAISLQGSNLGLWTNYSGRDPMVNSTPVGNLISDDGYVLPIPRKFAFNVRVEL